MKKHLLFLKYASKTCETIFSIVGDFFLLVEKPLIEVLHDTKRSSKKGYFKIVGRGGCGYIFSCFILFHRNFLKSRDANIL